MIVLGLTGSIGMGKTAVARMFEGLGVPVFYADAAAHEALAKSRLIQRALKRQYPKAFRNGALDRRNSVTSFSRTRTNSAALKRWFTRG